jgi:hypothetical protein
MCVCDLPHFHRNAEVSGYFYFAVNFALYALQFFICSLTDDESYGVQRHGASTCLLRHVLRKSLECKRHIGVKKN